MFELFNSVAYAETVAADTAATSTIGSSLPGTIIMMVAMVAIFYFMLIRPQRKKDKAVKDMLSSLKTGDRICTIGGIYGNIIALKEDTVTIAVGTQKVPVVLARWAIRSVEDAPLENDQELGDNK